MTARCINLHFTLLTYLLRQLHWLPVRQNVMFKIATLVHRSLSGNAAGYLADDCQLVADAVSDNCVLPTLHSSFGDRTFAAARPEVWNNLLPNLRLCGLSYAASSVSY